jgi:3-oxoadipate enol-lactonase
MSTAPMNHFAFRARRVQVDGVELSVTESGQGAPLVLVHGFPLDHRMWLSQIELLSGSAHVIAPDLRGFGASQVVPGTTTMQRMADDLAGLLDVLAVHRPVILCGLSMGGYVAFQFVRKYRERLAGLILADTRSLADTPQAAAGRFKLAEHVLQAGTGYAADAMLPKAFAPSSFRDHLAMTEFARQIVLEQSREGVAAALRGLAERPDVTSELPGMSLPALVIVGEQDAISPPDEMRAMAAAIPKADFVLIPDTGHLPPMENPLAFNAAVERFLNKVASAPAP